MASKKSVFISMGRPFTDDQSLFLDSLMEFLRQNALEPRVINKTDYPTGNPLSEISKIMKESSGAIIVAYERTFLEEGREKRNSPDELSLKSTRYTTPWNQIEATMAYALGMPILVLLENGLKEEGLLEAKYDWYVEKIDINEKALLQKLVRPRLEAWCRKVHERVTPFGCKGLTQDIKLADLFKVITVKTAWQLTCALASIFAAGIGVGLVLKKYLSLLNL